MYVIHPVTLHTMLHTIMHTLSHSVHHSMLHRYDFCMICNRLFISVREAFEYYHEQFDWFINVFPIFADLCFLMFCSLFHCLFNAGSNFCFDWSTSSNNDKSSLIWIDIWYLLYKWFEKHLLWQICYTYSIHNYICTVYMYLHTHPSMRTSRCVHAGIMNYEEATGLQDVKVNKKK